MYLFVFACLYSSTCIRAVARVSVCMLQSYKVLARKQFVSVSDGSFITTYRREPHLEIQRVLPHAARLYPGYALGFIVMKL